jgi:enoyl-CoA hydratase/carnithine racemase
VPLVGLTKEGGIALFEFNAPPANTYSYEMMRELDAAVLDARMDDSVHVLVLTGAGEKFFCAGADIHMLSRATPTFKYSFCLHANETLHRLEQTPKLVIAALNGHTVGGGLEVALAADLRVAKKDGGKLGLPEVKLGVLPGTGGTQRLARLVGRSRAIEMMIAGTLMSFDEAHALGLVNAVLAADRFRERALEYASEFVPPKKASKAVGAIKRSVASGLEASFSEGLALERELQQQLFLSNDAREGLAAHLEKREPKFQGS